MTEMMRSSTSWNEAELSKRQSELTALVNALGFTSINDLEEFIVHHGSVRLLPTAEIPPTTLDESQSQVQYDYALGQDRHQQRRHELVALEQKANRIEREVQLQKESALSASLSADVYKREAAALKEQVASLQETVERSKANERESELQLHQYQLSRSLSLPPPPPPPPLPLPSSSSRSSNEQMEFLPPPGATCSTLINQLESTIGALEEDLALASVNASITQDHIATLSTERDALQIKCDELNAKLDQEGSARRDAEVALAQFQEKERRYSATPGNSATRSQRGVMATGGQPPHRSVARSSESRSRFATTPGLLAPFRSTITTPHIIVSDSPKLPAGPTLPSISSRIAPLLPSPQHSPSIRASLLPLATTTSAIIASSQHPAASVPAPVPASIPLTIVAPILTAPQLVSIPTRSDLEAQSNRMQISRYPELHSNYLRYRKKVVEHQQWAEKFQRKWNRHNSPGSTAPDAPHAITDVELLDYPTLDEIDQSNESLVPLQTVYASLYALVRRLQLHLAELKDWQITGSHALMEVKKRKENYQNTLDRQQSQALTAMMVDDMRTDSGAAVVIKKEMIEVVEEGLKRKTSTSPIKRSPLKRSSVTPHSSTSPLKRVATTPRSSMSPRKSHRTTQLSSPRLPITKAESLAQSQREMEMSCLPDTPRRNRRKSDLFSVAKSVRKSTQPSDIVEAIELLCSPMEPDTEDSLAEGDEEDDEEEEDITIDQTTSNHLDQKYDPTADIMSLRFNPPSMPHHLTRSSPASVPITAHTIRDVFSANLFSPLRPAHDADRTIDSGFGGTIRSPRTGSPTRRKTKESLPLKRGAGGGAGGMTKEANDENNSLDNEKDFCKADEIKTTGSTRPRSLPLSSGSMNTNSSERRSSRHLQIQPQVDVAQVHSLQLELLAASALRIPSQSPTVIFPATTPLVSPALSPRFQDRDPPVPSSAQLQPNLPMIATPALRLPTPSTRSIRRRLTRAPSIEDLVDPPAPSSSFAFVPLLAGIPPPAPAGPNRLQLQREKVAAEAKRLADIAKEERRELRQKRKRLEEERRLAGEDGDDEEGTILVMSNGVETTGEDRRENRKRRREREHEVEATRVKEDERRRKKRRREKEREKEEEEEEEDGREPFALRSPPPRSTAEQAQMDLIARIQAKRRKDMEAADAAKPKPLHRLIEINPKRNQGETFAFLEVVRNKKARKDMHAFTCPDCSDYYKRMYPEAAAEFAKNPYSTKMHKELQAHLQLHSRHRAHSRLAHEPPEYWEMGFPTDEVVARVGVASEKIRRDERLFMESEADQENGLYRYVKTKK